MDISGEVFNVACGYTKSVLDVVAGINDILGKDIVPEFFDVREGDVFKTLASIEKLKSKLQVKDFISFEEGLKKTIDWFSKKEGQA